MKIIQIAILSCASIVFAQDNMFCNPPYSTKICPNNNHISCLSYWQSNVKWYNDMQVVDISQYQDLIISKHNQLRDKIASGNLANFPQAANLQVVVSIILIYQFISD